MPLGLDAAAANEGNPGPVRMSVNVISLKAPRLPLGRTNSYRLYPPPAMATAPATAARMPSNRAAN